MHLVLLAASSIDNFASAKLEALELLIDPGSHVRPVLRQAFREPQSNFPLGTVYTVTAVNDIAADINGILPSD